MVALQIFFATGAAIGSYRGLVAIEQVATRSIYETTRMAFEKFLKTDAVTMLRLKKDKVLRGKDKFPQALKQVGSRMDVRR